MITTSVLKYIIAQLSPWNCSDMEISKDALCEKIDQALLDFFETLSEIYLEQEKLDQYMKSGYLNMSRARYNMGIKSVGMDQWDKNNMAASLKVHISQDKQLTVDEGKESDIETTLNDLDLKSSEESSKVRRRNVGKSSNGTENEHIEEIVLKNDDTGIESNSDLQKKNGANKGTDPLKWFGILVPQSLKQSQRDFKASAQIAMTIASLKIKLSASQEEYRSLLKNKANLS